MNLTKEVLTSFFISCSIIVFHKKGIAIFAVAMFMIGGSGVASLWQEQIKAKQAEVDAAVAKSKDANKKIKYIVVEKIKVIHDKQVVVHNDIHRDAAEIDATCKVSPKAIKDLNEATE